MTAYVSIGPPQAAGFTFTYQLSVSAATLPMRIIKAEVAMVISGGTATSAACQFSSYIGGTITGGAGAITPSPLRQAAPASFASSRYGTVSDPVSTVTASSLSFSGGTSVSYGTSLRAIGSESEFQFPADYVINPGTAFVAQGSVTTGSSGVYVAFSVCRIYFEELRLSRSF